MWAVYENTPFAVILVGGGAVDVRLFDATAGAVLMGWLGGQAFGSAVAQVLQLVNSDLEPAMVTGLLQQAAGSQP